MAAKPTRPIKTFTVVSSVEAVTSIENHTSPFINKVNVLLSDGWELYGEASYMKSHNKDMVIIRQSMLKTEYVPVDTLKEIRHKD